jgi:hypothetical protein
MNIETAIIVHIRRSSQRYIVMVRRGRRSITRLQERVRKWEGLERMLGREDMIAKRMVLPIRAWFLSPIAEIKVAIMDRRAAESTDPGDTRCCECGWCASCEPMPSRTCFKLWDIKSKPMKRRKTDIAKPAKTSVRSSPNGCLIEERFQTSKFPRTSTTTHIVADIASKKIRWDKAVSARDPAAEYRTYMATSAWHAHHAILVVCSFDLLAQASLYVGIGRDAGSAKGARGGGSRKI